MHDPRASTSQPPERGILPIQTAINVTVYPCSKEGGCTFKTGSKIISSISIINAGATSVVTGREMKARYEPGGECRHQPRGHPPHVRCIGCTQTCGCCG